MLELGLLAAAVAIPVLFTIRGYRRGLLKTILSLASIILAFFLVGTLRPYVTEMINEKTPLRSMITESVDTVMRERVINELALPKEMNPEADTLDGMEITGEQEKEWLDICEIPEVFQEGIARAALEGADAFLLRVSEYIAGIIMKVLSFLVTFLVTFAIIRLLAVAVMIIGHMPVIKSVNQLLGGAFGLAEGMLILWLSMLLVTLLLPSELGQTIISAINSNPLLAAVYSFMLIPFH